MPMARYLYRHDPGAVVSLTPVFESYPMFRPADYRPQQVQSAQLSVLLDKGPVLFMSETPLPPPGIKAVLLYSEFPLTRFGYGAAGANFMRGYEEFSEKNRFLKLLPLHWYTLYRLERSATMRS
jgi:hypothetical protein